MGWVIFVSLNKWVLCAINYPMCVGEEPAQIWMLGPVQMSFESQHLDLPSEYP